MLGWPGVCYVTQADFKHSEFLCLRLFYDGGSKRVILCGLFICHFCVLVLDAFTFTLGGPHSFSSFSSLLEALQSADIPIGLSDILISTPFNIPKRCEIRNILLHCSQENLRPNTDHVNKVPVAWNCGTHL